MRWRWWMSLIIGFALLPLLLAGAVVEMVRSPLAQVAIARHTPLRIDGLRMERPLTIAADSLRVVDDGGAWLVITQPRLDWHLPSLWYGTLRLRAVTAQAVQVLRLPQSDAGPPAAPSLPLLPLTIAIDMLQVDTLTLAPALFGSEVTGRLSGEARLAEGRLRLALLVAGSGAGAQGEARLAVEGSSHLTVVASGWLRDLPADLRVASADWTLVGVAGLAEQRFDLGHLRLDTDLGQLSAVGWATETDTRLHLSSTLPDLSRLEPSLHGSAHIEADMAGAPTSPHVTAMVHPRNLSTGIAEFDNALGPQPRLRVAVGMAAGRPDLAFLHLRGAGGELWAGGHARLPLLLGLRLHMDDLTALTDPRWQGGGWAEGLLSGNPDDPVLAARFDVQGRLSGQPVTATLRAAAHHLIDAPLGQAHLEATALGRPIRGDAAFAWGPVARLDGLTLTSDADRVEGSLGWVRARDLVDGRLHGQIAGLRRWTTLAGLDLDGGLSFDAALTPGKGQDLRLSGQGRALSMAGVTAARADLQARLTDVLNHPNGQATAVLGDVADGSHHLTQLRLTAQGDDRSAAVTLDAAGDIAGSATGSVEPAQDRYTLATLQASLGNHQFRLLAPTTLLLKPGEQRLGPTQLAVGPGRIEMRGAIQGQSIEGRLTLTDLPAAWAEPLLPGWQPQGTLSGSADLAGSLQLPQLEARLSGHGLDAVGHHGGIEAEAQAHWDGRRINASLHATGLRGSRLEAQAGLPLVLVDGHPQWPDDGAVTGHVQGNGDLARLSELVPLGDQTISGHLSLDGDVGGTLAQPVINAQALVKGGTYNNFTTGTALSGITLSAKTADTHHVTIEAEGGDGHDGHFQAQGQAELDQGPSFAADLTATKLLVANLDLVRASADAQLHIAGSGEQGKASGQISVDGANVDIGQALPARVVTLKVVEINHPGGAPIGPPPKPERPPFILDLDIQAKLQRIHLAGRGLDSYWGGPLTLAGTAGTPTVQGQLRAERGSYDFFGRRLDLDTGSTVSFDGQQPINPRFDLTARGPARDVTAIIKVTGTADNPSLEFTSDPVVPQDEVLARLLFNKEAGQLTVIQQLTLARAAAGQIAGGGNDFDPLGKVRQTLGLDTLEAGSGSGSSLANAPNMPSLPVSTGASGNTSLPTAVNSTTTAGTGTSLAAGKYIDDRTYVRVEQGTTGGNATVNVELGHGFSVETLLGENAGGGAGISWRKDY